MTVSRLLFACALSEQKNDLFPAPLRLRSQSQRTSSCSISAYTHLVDVLTAFSSGRASFRPPASAYPWRTFLCTVPAHARSRIDVPFEFLSHLVEGRGRRILSALPYWVVFRPTPLSGTARSTSSTSGLAAISHRARTAETCVSRQSAEALWCRCDEAPTVSG